MKWNKESDEKLKTLINLGKDYNEIIKEINVTYRSISNRAFRLGLKIIKPHREDILCKNCGEIINKTISDEKQFCNSSCSAQYNNKGRKHTKETKNKIRNKLREISNTKEKKVNPIKTQRVTNLKNCCKINKNITPRIKYTEIKLRKCRFCGEEKFIPKYKIICEECGINYYKHYRPLCEFDFKISKYKEEFDLSLVNEYGWYSPTNKRNNIDGVSKDHIYSVKDGFINKIDPNIIKHPANCELMIHIDNNKKNTQSFITLDELLMKIKVWNRKYLFG